MKKKVGDTMTQCYREYVISKAKENCSIGTLVMDQHDMLYFLGVIFHIPKERRMSVLKECIDYGWIIKINRGRGKNLFKILGC